MTTQRVTLSKMTDRGIIDQFNTWLRGPNKEVRVRALEYLLGRRSPKDRTFLKLHEHLMGLDPTTAINYRDFYSIFSGWSGLNALLDSRENQIHGDVQRMQEINYFKAHKTKPLPIHMWLRSLEVKGKLPGITDLLHQQEKQISHMATVQLTIQRMFPELFHYGVISAAESFPEIKKHEKLMMDGESVIPADWRLKVNPKYRQHLRQVVEEYFE